MSSAGSVSRLKLWPAVSALLTNPAVCLGMITVCGGFLRLQALAERYPAGIQLAGSALEYRRMADYLLHPGAVGPPGNPMGMPLVLSVLFAVLPCTKDAIQVVLTTACGLALAPLAFVLARRWVGTIRALLVAALVAVNTSIIDNSVVGTTEEVFALCLLVLLWLWGRPRTREERGGDLTQSLVLGVVAACLVLIRKDGVLLLAPLGVGVFIRAYRRGGATHALWLAGAVLALPLAALGAADWYQDLAGIKNSYWRGARAYYWFDFFRGRMPWEYRFYARVNLAEWWFGMHTGWQMLNITLRSTARTVLSIGESVGGQAVLLLSLAGALWHARQQRDLLLQLAIPLCLVPQLLWIYFSSDVDAFRYIVRIIPLVLILAAVAEAHLSRLLAPSLHRLHRRAVILAWPGVLLGGLVIVGLLSPWSIYRAALPWLSCQQAEQDHRLGGPIYVRLGDLWSDFTHGELPASSAQKRLRVLEQEHPRYAPTRYVQGLVAMRQGDLAVARVAFSAAVELVPRFAEAAAWLAEVDILRGDLKSAAAVLDRAIQLRPEFPLFYLVRGDLHLLVGQRAAATAAYRKYLSTNAERRREALERAWRLLARGGMKTQAAEVARKLERLDRDEVQLLDGFLWNYLSYDLHRIDLPVPFDRYVYLNLGLAELEDGNLQSALQALTLSTRVTAESDVCWNGLAQAHRAAGDLDEAAAVLRAGSSRCTDSAMLRKGLACVLALQGRWHEAAALCHAGASVSPPDAVLAKAGTLLRSGLQQQTIDLLARSWSPSTPVYVLPLTRAILTSPGRP